MKEYFFDKIGIYYRTNEFKPGRKTLVFVHGLSGSSAAWEPYEKKFENDYNILTYDLRGHGKSFKLKNLSDYSIPNFASDLEEIISFLNLNDFFLINHSFGTLIGLEYLVKNQTKVKGVVFLSPGYEPGARLAAKITKPFLELSRILYLFPFSQKPRGHVDYSKFINTGDWNIPRMIADISMTSLRVYLFSSLKSLFFNRKDFLKKITIPTLIIHGKKDTIFPWTNSEYMHKEIKTSKIIYLENADHILVLNNFKEVSDAVFQFINLLSS